MTAAAVEIKDRISDLQDKLAAAQARAGAAEGEADRLREALTVAHAMAVAMVSGFDCDREGNDPGDHLDDDSFENCWRCDAQRTVNVIAEALKERP